MTGFCPGARAPFAEEELDVNYCGRLSSPPFRTAADRSNRRPHRALLTTLVSGLIGSSLAATPSPAVAAPAVSRPDALRSRVSLAGIWQTTRGADPQSMPTAGWTEVRMPHTEFVAQGAPPFTWYWREVVIPANWTGRRVFVDIRTARNAPHLFVDGKPAGGQLDGWSPLRVEITSLVKPGTRHRLELRCQNADFARVSDPVSPPAGATAAPGGGKVIAPLGGYKDLIGSWDQIYLCSTPADRLDERELVITPSVRQKTLTLTGKVDSARDDLWIEARVLEPGAGSREALRLPAQHVAADKTWTLSAPFLRARHWSPEDPHLYSLEIQIRQGSAKGPLLDRMVTRFGFKEIWTQGSDFYLNGVKRHLLGASTWPNTSYEDPAVIRQRVRAIRASGAIAFRLHIGAWQEAWLDAADEVGLLIIDESAVYTDGDGSYGYHDPRFWQNYRDHIAGMIRRDRNRACLAMWSLGNEVLFMGNQKYDPELPNKLGELARFARKLDPSHPLTFEADLDPGSAYDVIGLHYPHELPWHPDYPNTCDWIAVRTTAEAGGGMLGQQSNDFFWDRRKPLYIGEYLWVPQGDFSVASIFYGDEAFQNRERFHHQAQGRAFYEQTLAFRRAGVSGMSPWATFGFGGVNENPLFYTLQKDFYRPVAAFWRERSLRCFAGERRTFRFDVFNDSPHTQALTLKLVRTDTGAVLGSRPLKLAPGDYQEVGLSFPLPTGASAIPVESILYSGGQPVHRERQVLQVTPSRPLSAPTGTTLVAYDPQGRWPNAVQNLTSLATVPSRTVLLIAPGALSSPFDAAAFRNFLARGGRALVLEQETLAPLDLGMELVDFASTMAFPLRPDHPMLRGLSAEDLKFWRGDNYVAKKQIRRPASGGGQAVVVTGGQNGLDNAPVVDLPVGKSGRVLFVQALAGAKRSQDPAAQRLLQNAIDLLAAPAAAQPTRGRTVVVTDAPEFAARLRKLGVQSAPIEGRALTSAYLQNATVLALHGAPPGIRGAAATAAIAAFVRQGGSLYWHAPEVNALKALNAALGGIPGRLRVAPMECGVSLYGRNHPLLTGVSREDLTYTSTPTGWNRQMSFDPRTADRLFLPVAPKASQPARRIEAEDGVIERNTQARERGVGFANFDRRGAVSLSVTVPRAGLYPLTLIASGTAQDGVAPLVQIGANDLNTTSFFVGRTGWQRRLSLVPLSAGKNRISVRFLNGAEWGGARRLRVDAVELGAAPVTYPQGMEPLALPGALVTWTVGKGKVVLDGIGWTANETNARRGDRYASALFTNLGALFTLPESRQKTARAESLTEKTQ